MTLEEVLERLAEIDDAGEGSDMLDDLMLDLERAIAEAEEE